MRELTFKTMFGAFLPMIGRDMADFPVGSVDAERHCTAINAALRIAYGHEFWPEILTIEERTPDADNVVAQFEDGETEIDTMQGLFSTETDARAFSRMLPAARIPEGWMLQTAYDSVWARFRPVAPRFTMRRWDAEVSYSANDPVYFEASGKCYKALQASAGQSPETSPTYWEEQSFPGFFEVYVQIAAAADHWRFERQWSQAGEMQTLADKELFRLKVIAKQQGGGA